MIISKSLQSGGIWEIGSLFEQFCSKTGWLFAGKKLTNNLQFRSGQEAAPFFVGADGRGEDGPRTVIIGVGNENKNLVL